MNVMNLWSAIAHSLNCDEIIKFVVVVSIIRCQSVVGWGDMGEELSSVKCRGEKSVYFER